MKHYKKFYEIGNNRYYTIVADDEMYIANESFLKVKTKKLFRKEKELNTGFKVLKFSPAIAKLFNELANLKPKKNQRYDADDLIIYKHINNRKLKESIEKAYTEVIDNTIKEILNLQNKYIAEGNTKLADSCADYLQKLKHVDPLEGIDLVSPEHTACNIIKTMLKNGLEHLYTERVNAFTNNVYLYEQDEFGTLTIYKIITIKNVVKDINTFIYDKNLVECLLKTLYEEGR